MIPVDNNAVINVLKRAMPVLNLGLSTAVQRGDQEVQAQCRASLEEVQRLLNSLRRPQ
jgi:hypothetical protein